jgi:hypothetical protein
MQHEVGPALARRYGLDLALCAGAPFGDRPWQWARYVVGGDAGGDATEVAAVRVRGWHNVGNMVQQLLHALTFAERHGIAVVSGPANPWFDSGPAGTVRLALARPFPRPALVGYYFYPQPLGLAQPWRPQHQVEALRTLFRVRPDPSVTPEEVVVHLRSGDVFGPDPHPDYRPPGMGYYTSALERVVADDGVVAARLVCQDRVHPLLGPLEAWCRRRGLTTRVQVSDDLHADLATLTAARSLVLSQGTLGLSAAWLSRAVRSVVLPRGNHVGELRALGVRVLEADLPAGDPWLAGPDQVAALARERAAVDLVEVP